MAEFTVVSQWIETTDPMLGAVSEELRTLQVKRPVSAVERKEARTQWQRFGAAKGKVGPERGITDILKEELLIELPSAVWGKEEDDKIAHRLVSTVGRMTISSGLSRHNSAGQPQPAGSSGTLSSSSSTRRGSGEGGRSHSRKNSGGSTGSGGAQEAPLPQPPASE